MMGRQKPQENENIMLTDDRQDKLERVARNRQEGFTVVIEDVFDPHNLGAVTRTCDAFGIQDIHVIFETQPEYDPKEVGKNSSTATNKWINYHIHHNTEDGIQHLKDDGWLTVATVIDPDAESIFEADLTHPKIAVLMGNEKRGLSDRAMQMADKRVTIPMVGIAQSMNISVSAALFIYEVTRQRRAVGIDPYLKDEDGVQKTLNYFQEMQEYFRKRNKRKRKDRALRRQKTEHGEDL
jgi:tRNA (guanosine-2'-O-)-methyltransferase